MFNSLVSITKVLVTNIIVTQNKIKHEQNRTITIY